jgi:hypothetical protein
MHCSNVNKMSFQPPLTVIVKSLGDVLPVHYSQNITRRCLPKFSCLYKASRYMHRRAVTPGIWMKELAI